MEIIIVLISILAITALTGWLNKFLPFKVCPVCFGVSGTWLGLTAMILSGQLPITDYQLLIAILMGGSAAGIAYQGEKKFLWARESIFRFKVPAVIIGFALVYWAIRNLSWLVFSVELAALAILAYIFFLKPSAKLLPPAEAKRVAELEKQMDKCC